MRHAAPRRNGAVSEQSAPMASAATMILLLAAVIVAYATVATVFGSEGIFTLDLVPTALVVAVVNAALTIPAMRVARFAVLAGDRRPV